MPNADGSVAIEFDVDVSKANKELAKLKKSIASLEKTINEQEAKKSPLVAQAEALNQQMKEARAEVQRYQQAWTAGVPGADKEQSAAEGRLNNMQTQHQKIVEQINKIDAKLIPAYEKLDRMETEAGGLQQQINESETATHRMAEATAAAGKYMDKFTKRVKGLAKRIFVFTLITRALSSLRTWLWNTIKSNDEAAAAVAKLKGALLTLAQPLLEIIIPAFTALVNILAAVVSKIASFIAMLFGTTYEDASKSAEALYNEQDAISGVGSAAKKAAKSLAAFDEINKLSDSSAGSGGGSSSAIAPNFDTVILSEGMENVLTIVEKIGAALLGWGFSKLFFKGLDALTDLKIPKKVSIGISLAIAGAAVTAENIASILSGEYGATSLKSAISSAVSGLMIGAGLIAAGASTFVLPIAIVATFLITDLVVNWEQYKEMWSHELDAAKAFLRGDSEGFWSSASDAFLVWLQTDSWTQKLGKAILGEDVWNDAIAYLESGGTFDHAFSSFWDIVSEWFDQQKWSDLAANGFLGIGSAFAAWAETGFPPKVQEWITWLKENFFNQGFFNLLGKESFSGLLDYLGGDFYKEWKSTWSDTGTALKEGLNGMITHFESFVNYCISAINRLIDAINTISSKGNGILSKFTIPNIPQVKLPRLATGAVIPPNREFMAVLGDQKSGNNIEAPEALIRRIVREESGTGGGNQTVVLEIDGQQFAKVVYQLNRQESRRIGLRLAEV